MRGAGRAACQGCEPGARRGLPGAAPRRRGGSRRSSRRCPPRSPGSAAARTPLDPGWAAEPLLLPASPAGSAGGGCAALGKCSSDPSLPPCPGRVKCEAAGGAVRVCVCVCEQRSVAAVFPGACSLTPVAAPLTAPRPPSPPPPRTRTRTRTQAAAGGHRRGVGRRLCPGRAPAAPWSGPAARAEGGIPDPPAAAAGGGKVSGPGSVSACRGGRRGAAAHKAAG